MDHRTEPDRTKSPTGTGQRSGPLAWVGGLGLESVGFLIVGLFVATWVLAVAFWRFGRLEERWSSRPDSPARADDHP